MANINEFFVNVPADVLASFQDLDLAVIPQPLRDVISRLPSALLNAAPPVSTDADKIICAASQDYLNNLFGHSGCLSPMPLEPHILPGIRSSGGRMREKPVARQYFSSSHN